MAFAQTPPARVVSMNLCTDQLAMMLAAPGQLLSVSYIARDPMSSAMVEAAQAYPINHGRAEEIFAMRPDLVLAGSYSNPATIALLRRLGVRVETFPPASSVDQVVETIRAVGAALGHPAPAKDMAQQIEAAFEPPRPDPNTPRPLAAFYYANGYSLGDGSLAVDILKQAGFDNIGGQYGLHRGGTLPLERLIMAAPDLVISGQRYTTPSRAEAILDHPALAALNRHVWLDDRDWVCGTPTILRALTQLQTLRHDIAPNIAAPAPANPAP